MERRNIRFTCRTRIPKNSNLGKFRNVSLSLNIESLANISNGRASRMKRNVDQMESNRIGTETMKAKQRQASNPNKPNLRYTTLILFINVTSA